MIQFIKKIVRVYDILVTQSTIEHTILTHPNYPSMRCISDALDSWTVKHAVLKLSFDKLRTLDIPVIAHLKRGEYGVSPTFPTKPAVREFPTKIICFYQR